VAERLNPHEFIRWKPEQQQWFCILCGRTSDHHSARDARTELEQFACEPPAPRSHPQQAEQS
jgi:hypothetical protein